MKCLVVSDSATMRRILENAVTLAGCDELVVCTDGRQAAEYTDASVAGIVTDWGLPGMTGLDLTRHIRSRPECSNIRILMVTSRNARTDVERAVEAGVDGYLLKPFTPDALRLKVEALLRPMSAIEDEEAGEDEAKAA